MSDQPTLVDLNTASKEDLMTLPGIGESLANRILATRPFNTTIDLVNVSGIGEEVFKNLQPLITASQAVETPEILEETVAEPSDQPVVEVESIPEAEAREAEETSEETTVEDMTEYDSQAELIEPVEEVEEISAEEAPEVESTPEAESERIEEVPEESTVEAEAIEGEAVQEEEIAFTSDEIPGTVGVFPVSAEAEEALQPLPSTEEEAEGFGPPPETPPEPEVELAQPELLEEEPPEPPQAEVKPDAKRQPNLVTRSGAFWMAAVSGIIAFFLAVAFTLGLLAVVNDGLQYVSPASFNALQSQVNGLNNQAATLQQDVNGLRTRVDNLEGLSGRVDTLEQNGKQLRSDLDSASSQLKNLDQQVNGLAGEVSTLTSDVNDLKTSVGVFQQFINGLRDLLNGLGK